jgi:hypothetical protein
MSSGTDAAFFNQILDHLRQTRGFDFTACKRSSLMRRVVRRMQMVNVTSVRAISRRRRAAAARQSAAESPSPLREVDRAIAGAILIMEQALVVA